MHSKKKGVFWQVEKWVISKAGKSLKNGLNLV